MKLTIGSLALALLAIATLMNSVTAITGTSLNMVANKLGGSSFVATFVDPSVADKSNNVLYLDAILSGVLGEYAEMTCVTELDIGSSRPASTRTLSTPVTEVQHSKPGYVNFKAGLRLRPGDILGKFQLVCSFIPTKRDSRGLVTSVFATVNQDEGFVTTSAMIHPFSGFAQTFTAFISTTHGSQTPTTFKITDPFSNIKGKAIRIQNPVAAVATSGTTAIFSSVSEASSCEAYWDGVLQDNTVTAFVPNSGAYVDLKFSAPINTSSEILLYCGGVIGQKRDPLLPAILEANYALTSTTSSRNYAVSKFFTE